MKPDSRFLDENAVMQVCFVTPNLERTAQWFADLIGAEMPQVHKAAEPDAAQATYHGQPARVGCRLVVFQFGNIDLEILEPGPEKSAWRDLLEARGPGCHHIAFRTRNLKKRKDYLESKGHPLIQQGEFDGGGGRYAYFDTVPDLGALIELLEFDKDREPQA